MQMHALFFLTKGQHFPNCIPMPWEGDCATLVQTVGRTPECKTSTLGKGLLFGTLVKPKVMRNDIIANHFWEPSAAFAVQRECGESQECGNLRSKGLVPNANKNTKFWSQRHNASLPF